MAEQRTYNGHVYTRNGPNDDWVLASPAQSGTVIDAPESPKTPLEVQILRGNINKQGRDAATAPFDYRKAAADAAKAEADAKKAQAEADAKSALTPADKAATDRMAQDELLHAITSARREIGSGILPTTGFGSGFARSLGGTSATDLAGSLTTIKSRSVIDKLGQMKSQSPTGASGMGALSEKEAAYLESSIASLDQNSSKEKLLDGLAEIEKHYRRLNALSDGKNPDDPKVAASYGLVIPGAKSDANGGGTPPDLRGAGSGLGGGGGSPTSDGKYVNDPALQGVNDHVAHLIKQGATEADIRAYLNAVQPGMGDRTQNLDKAIKYNNQYPATQPNLKLEQVWQPNGGVTKTLGDIGQSALGTGVINAADMLTGGNLDSMTGDPALARATMAGVSTLNPKSALAGQIFGGALASGGIEGGLGRMGATGAGKLIGGDALFGSIYGAGSNDENRVGGAMGGTVAGVAGGMFGRGLARGAGRLTAGVRDAGAQYLNRAGVPMTFGQMIGGGAKAFEDRLSGFPLVGDAINARRAEGLQGFNKAAFNEALAPISADTGGQIAEGGIRAGQDAYGQAYGQALDGKQFQIDPQFANDLLSARAKGAAIPQLGDQFDALLSNRVGSLFDNGTLTGRNFQAAQQGLRKGAAAAKNEIMGPEFGSAAGQAEDALRGMVYRQSPEVIPQLDNANTAFGNMSALEDAVLRAKNTGGVFTPAQLGMSSVGNTMKFGGKHAAAAGDRPFFDLQRAGQDILPSKIPDSGTAGRFAIPAIAGALGGGGAAYDADGNPVDKAQSGALYGLTAATLAATPYSRAARAAVQKTLMAERPDIIINAGNSIANRARLGGMFGAPIALDYNNLLLGGQ